MYVSKILGLNNQNNYRLRQKNMVNSSNIVFKGDYASTFRNGLSRNFKQLEPDVSAFCKDLLQQVKSGRGFYVSPSIRNVNGYGRESVPSLLRKLCISNGEVIARDAGGEKLVETYKYSDGKSITFFNPEGDMYITIEEAGSSYELTRGSLDEYGQTEIFRFYDLNENSSGRLKSHTTASGSGVGALSETTYYNPDGSVREGRTFINRLFGL